jgi:hypothetical protein
VNELEGMINGLLSNPGEMKKLMDAAGKILNSNDINSNGKEAFEDSVYDRGRPPDEETILAARRNVSEDPKRDKKKLVEALKPWLSEKRRYRLDKALMLAKVVHIVGAAAFGEGGGE